MNQATDLPKELDSLVSSMKLGAQNAAAPG
jgi:hypothetical protein